MSKKWLFLAIFLFGALLLSAGGVYFVTTFPKRHPEKTLKIEHRITVFLEQITLPIKIAQLSAQEPDTQILIPVYGVRLSGIQDTWGSPRGEDRTHEGQDLFATKGTPIFSGTNGYVLRIGKSNLGGNIVYVIGAGGRRYYYAHLDSIAKGLHAGQKITTDTILGFVGNTGNASTTPPHLHFGVYEMHKAINPLPLMVNR